MRRNIGFQCVSGQIPVFCGLLSFCIHRCLLAIVRGYEPSCKVVGPLVLTHLSSKLAAELEFAHPNPFDCCYPWFAARKLEIDLTRIRKVLYESKVRPYLQPGAQTRTYRQQISSHLLSVNKPYYALTARVLKASTQ